LTKGRRKIPGPEPQEYYPNIIWVEKNMPMRKTKKRSKRNLHPLPLHILQPITHQNYHQREKRTDKIFKKGQRNP